MYKVLSIVCAVMLLTGLVSCTKAPLSDTSVAFSQSTGQTGTSNTVSTVGKADSTVTTLTTDQRPTKPPSTVRRKTTTKNNSQTSTDAAKDFPVNQKTDGKYAVDETKFRSIMINSEKSGAYMTVDIPQSWKLAPVKSKKNMWDITLNARYIGKLSVVLDPLSDNIDVLSSYDVYENCLVQERSHSYSDGQKSFTRNVVGFIPPVNGTLETYMRIEVDIRYFSDQTASAVAESIRFQSPVYINKKTNIKTVNKERLLLLGNSFIGSSRVGDFLAAMVDDTGKNAEVTAECRGYYSVSQYLQDTLLMSQIRKGQYDIVFLCGFYSFGDAADFPEFQNICNQSNTLLVVFPAHNEGESWINSVFDYVDYPVILNWKNAIDNLIKSGISREQFCINDMHNHTTPLGGYVGAGLIYTLLFEEKAPPLSQYSYLLSSYIDNKNALKIESSISSFLYPGLSKTEMYTKKS